eukprot:7054392-Heterocapsa_arctica.AAC.1
MTRRPQPTNGYHSSSSQRRLRFRISALKKGSTSGDLQEAARQVGWTRRETTTVGARECASASGQLEACQAGPKGLRRGRGVLARGLPPQAPRNRRSAFGPRRRGSLGAARPAPTGRAQRGG